MDADFILLKDSLMRVINESDVEIKLRTCYEKISKVTVFEERKALMIEYNKLKEATKMIKCLCDNNQRLCETKLSLYDIRDQVRKTLKPVPTNDIDSLMSLVESDPLGTLVCLLRKNDSLIDTQDYIKRLNKCIIRDHQRHGIVYQLRELPKDGHITSVGLEVRSQCKKCKNEVYFTGNSSCDIFAPKQCGQCKDFAMEFV